MARDAESGVGVLDEETLIDAISSGIDPDDPDAEQKARSMADILVYLATMPQGTSDNNSDVERRRGGSNVGKSRGPVSRLPVRRG